MSYALVGLVSLIALCIVILIAWRHGHRRISVGFGWFLAAWLPISGVFPLNAPLAEHWMYVPMIGFWWALAECLQLLMTQHNLARRAAYAATAALCIVFIVMTAQRNRDWSDNVRLFTATLAQNPDSARVQYNLAVTYESDGNLAGARRHYEKFLEIRARERAALTPDRMTVREDEIETRLALGRVLMQLTEYSPAVNTLAPLIQLAEYEGWRPAAALAAMKTGQALIALGEVVQANAYLEQTLRIEPQLAHEIEQILAGAPIYDGY
jgi:tetratricopeptide (TPR) repeat protein